MKASLATVIELCLCEGGRRIMPGANFCEESDCRYCCPHDERDHGICPDCGDEDDGSAAIDRAMDYGQER